MDKIIIHNNNFVQRESSLRHWIPHLAFCFVALFYVKRREKKNHNQEGRRRHGEEGGY